MNDKVRKYNLSMLEIEDVTPVKPRKLASLGDTLVLIAAVIIGLLWGTGIL